MVKRIRDGPFVVFNYTRQDVEGLMPNVVLTEPRAYGAVLPHLLMDHISVEFPGHRLDRDRGQGWSLPGACRPS